MKHVHLMETHTPEWQELLNLAGHMLFFFFHLSYF